jgi:hypothetical protein
MRLLAMRLLAMRLLAGRLVRAGPVSRPPSARIRRAATARWRPGILVVGTRWRNLIVRPSGAHDVSHS